MWLEHVVESCVNGTKKLTRLLLPRAKTPFAFSYPHTYHFLMTNYCNAQCIFCNQRFNHQTKKEINFEIFKAMLAHLPTHSAKTFYFSGGGEPLLCPDLFKSIKHVNTLLPWVEVRIRTNGLLIAKYAQDLARLNIACLEISVHGRAQTNDALIQRKGSQEIFAGITVLNRHLEYYHNKMQKAFCQVVSRINIEETPELIKKASALKINAVMVDFCRYFPYALTREEGKLQAADSLFFHKQLYNDVMEKSRLLALVLGIGFYTSPLFFQDYQEIQCCQPWQIMLVDWDGDVYPCTGGEEWFKEEVKSGRYYFGNLLKEHVRQFWNNDTYKKIRMSCSPKYRRNFIPECKNCHMGICLRGSDVKNGHIIEWDLKRGNCPSTRLPL